MLSTPQISSDRIDLVRLPKLKRDFYTQDALKVAKNLLGCIFVKEEGQHLLAARITEVEAYKQKNDEAAHSYRGKTKRNKVMFYEGGYLYVYFIYGVHYCANIVTGKKEEGDAVLLRGMEPLLGIESMIKNRFEDKVVSNKRIKDLLKGPGNICKAFGIDKSDDGTDLTGNRIYLLKGDNEINIKTSERIGITKSKELKWRFYID
ncbi:MAG: DNA-3-methyladenine glycosylase [Ignavibacteria bacterium]|nr:MAG: DNA-3-methyladenine glycosylase [Ignavibacteria bacterium]